MYAYNSPAAVKRQEQAARMRETAYREIVQILRRGLMGQPQAVQSLRLAYRMAARHERGVQAHG